MRKVGTWLRRLHEDERGEIPVGQILVIGMVVIPLVIALVGFGNSITAWLGEVWEEVNGETITQPKYPTGSPTIDTDNDASSG